MPLSYKVNDKPRIMTTAATVGNPMDNEVIQLLQKTITELDAWKHWGEKAFLKAQELGLQGEKRRERDYLTEIAYCLEKDYQSKALDAFNVIIEPEEIRKSFELINDYRSYFQALKQALWEEYHTLHDLANKFVVANYKPLACDLYDFTECLWDVIIKVQRIIKEGDATEWMPHHVLIYQVSYENVHDYYEKKKAKA